MLSLEVTMTPNSQQQAEQVRVLGLDPSLTSFGVCRLTMARPGLKTYKTHTKVWSPKIKGANRLDWFVRSIDNELVEFEPDLIVLEGYAFNRGNQAHQIGELGGVIRLALFLKDRIPVIIAPAKLKKFVTGKGNANKELVMMDGYKRFGIDVPTTDEVEATALAIMGAVGTHGLQVSLPQVNLAALEGVVWK